MIEQDNKEKDNVSTERHKICEVIKNARQKRGWNQGDLANAVGIKRTHISRIESGKHNFTVNHMLMIMNALDINVIDLCDFDNEAVEVDDIDVDIVGNPNYPAVKLVKKSKL